MTETWWLKLDRAEHHLKKLDREVARYVHMQPYRAERKKQPQGKRHLWVYVLRFTEEPNPNIPLIVGDIVHNMRTALDHLAVAMSDKRHRGLAAFPIESKPIWDRTPDGSYVVNDDDARDRFNKGTAGLTPEAVALVKEMQPYNSGEHAPRDALGVLGILDNADKHRQLNRVVFGLEDTLCLMRHEKGSVLGAFVEHSAATGFRRDGAEIGRFDLKPIDPQIWSALEAEMQVQVYGTLFVSLKIPDVEPATDARELWRVLGYLREQIVPALEGHVR